MREYLDSKSPVCNSQKFGNEDSKSGFQLEAGMEDVYKGASAVFASRFIGPPCLSSSPLRSWVED